MRTERKIKYKVLEEGLRSPYQTFCYELDKSYHCNNFNDDPTIDCAAGFYATDIEGLPYTFQPGKDVLKCEVWGREAKYNIYKWRFENIRILRRLNKPEIIEKAKAAEKECGYLLSEILFPVNPLLKTQKVTQKQVDLLKEWITAGAAVEGTVWDSVGTTIKGTVENMVWSIVWDSVEGPIWDRVGETVWAMACDTGWDTSWDTIWDTIWDTVRAYISSLFPNIKKWKYIDHEPAMNPFQSCIDLWRSGFVVSYNGDKWRLHTGPEADIVYEHKEKTK